MAVLNNNFKRRLGYKHQSGIAVVEFAIGVLLLIFLLLVTAEVGRAFYSYNTLTKAVRGGARYISDHSTLPTGAVAISAAEESNTQNLVVHGNIAGSGNSVLPNFVLANVTVQQAFPSASGIPYVEVRASYGFQPLFGTIAGFSAFDEINLAFNMRAASTMRVQR